MFSISTLDNSGINGEVINKGGLRMNKMTDITTRRLFVKAGTYNEPKPDYVFKCTGKCSPSFWCAYFCQEKFSILQLGELHSLHFVSLTQLTVKPLVRILSLLISSFRFTRWLLTSWPHWHNGSLRSVSASKCTKFATWRSTSCRTDSPSRPVLTSSPRTAHSTQVNLSILLSKQ